MQKQNITYKGFTIVLYDNGTAADIVTPEGYSFDYVKGESVVAVIVRAKKLVDNRLSTPAVSNMEIFAQLDDALERYHNLFKMEDYQQLYHNAKQFEPLRYEKIIDLVINISMGLCDFPHYSNTLVTNLLTLFTLIESPVLSRMVISYINRFK